MIRLRYFEQGGDQKRKLTSTTTMPSGQKTKKTKHNKNISRLINQSKDSPTNSDSTPHFTPPHSQAPSPEPTEVQEDFDIFNHFDSLRADFGQEEEDGCSDEEEEECGDIDELMELSSKDLAEKMINMMLEDDPDDHDWIPERLSKKASK